jgi:hypothetical protein
MYLFKIIFVLMFIAVGCLLLASLANAQTITPLTSECSKKCSGSFIVRNDGLKPLRVVLEPHGFEVLPTGDVKLTPLAQGVDIELGARSATVDIGQSHQFFFRMKCDSIPCRAQIMCFMQPAQHTSEGIVLNLGLPHIVYLCDKKKDCRVNTLRSLGYDVAKK